MDKKNTILGILFLGGAFFLVFWQGRQAEDFARQQEQQQQEQAQQEPPPVQADEAAEPVSPLTAPAGDTPSQTPANQEGAFTLTGSQEPQLKATPTDDSPEELVTLENDAIRVTFTTRGGAIKYVEFIADNARGGLKYPATLDEPEIPYVFNAGGVLPALAISLDTDADGTPEEYAPSYRLENKTAESVYFTYQDPNGIRIRRIYTIESAGSENDPYVISHNTGFQNTTAQDLPGRVEIYVNVGTAPPTEGDVWGEYLNFGYYDGADAEFIKMSKFKGSKGFLGIGASAAVKDVDRDVEPVVWGAIKNQFFTGVLTPDRAGVGVYAKDTALGGPIKDPEMQKGITGAIRFDLGMLRAGGAEQELGMSYYVGPKEYTRLSQMEQKQDLVMQFGFFGGISKLLLMLMIWIHDLIVPIAPTWGWGFTIIIVTIIVKTLLFPLTQVQVKSAKRMAKIQPLMQEMREKYKDDPQEMQKRTMALFKEHRVNPAAGCLPLLLQIPIFFALFFMLRTASELRFAPFLWVPDLSVSDTVAYVAGFPINPLPLLMAATMFLQMQMMPTPTTDNIQRTLFKFKPIVVLVFCYNFPAGLVLYWTCQNIFTIGQQFVTNRLYKDEDLAAPDPDKPRKPSLIERLEKAKSEQEAAKKKLSGKGLPQQKKKKKR
ncbi:MAG: membrane protein insertase YidC [Verrucomicrobiota bacterium]